jgi:hypothetical protein
LGRCAGGRSRESCGGKRHALAMAWDESPIMTGACLRLHRGGSTQLTSTRLRLAGPGGERVIPPTRRFFGTAPLCWWHARCMPELLCPGLVGRDQELRVLRSALDRLAAGHGTTLVVVGEAGVGKSRLIREAAADAGGRGVPVLVGRAVERESPNGLRPLAEALFSHLRRSGPPRAPELAAFRPILGRLIPEWRLSGESPGELSLVVLGEAVLRVLAAVNEGVGCVLVLEDLQWADADTVEVVEYLADNVADQPILCLISLREEEPSLALSRVHNLAARRSASILQLGRLTAEEVSAVAAGCLAVCPFLPGWSRCWFHGPMVCRSWSKSCSRRWCRPVSCGSRPRAGCWIVRWALLFR